MLTLSLSLYLSSSSCVSLPSRNAHPGVDGALPQASLILVEHYRHCFQLRLGQRCHLWSKMCQQNGEYQHQQQQQKRTKNMSPATKMCQQNGTTGEYHFQQQQLAKGGEEFVEH